MAPKLALKEREGGQIHSGDRYTAKFGCGCTSIRCVFPATLSFWGLRHDSQVIPEPMSAVCRGILPSESSFTENGCFLSFVSGINHNPNVGSSLVGPGGLYWTISRVDGKPTVSLAPASQPRFRCPKQIPVHHPRSMKLESESWAHRHHLGKWKETIKQESENWLEAWLWLCTIGIF